MYINVAFQFSGRKYAFFFHLKIWLATLKKVSWIFTHEHKIKYIRMSISALSETERIGKNLNAHLRELRKLSLYIGILYNDLKE